MRTLINEMHAARQLYEEHPDRPYPSNFHGIERSILLTHLCALQAQRVIGNTLIIAKVLHSLCWGGLTASPFIDTLHRALCEMFRSKFEVEDAYEKAAFILSTTSRRGVIDRRLYEHQRNLLVPKIVFSSLTLGMRALRMTL